MLRTVDERAAVLDSIHSTEGAAEVRLLEKAVCDRSPWVRLKAIDVISKLTASSALPLVESLLKDRSERVRYQAAKCLGHLLEDRGVSHQGLRLLLDDKSPLVRIEAIESLVLLNDRTSLALLSSKLADSDPLVRAYAARALGEMEGDSYVHAVEMALLSEADDSARAGMMEALLLLGRREIYPAFLELLNSSDYRVCCAVANGLDGLPLDRAQLKRGIAALSTAYQTGIGVADRATVGRVLNRLRRGARKMIDTAGDGTAHQTPVNG